MRHLSIQHVTDPATGKVYPIPAGGAEDPPAEDPPADDPEDDPPADEPDEPEDKLGDAGKRALQAERDRAKAAEKRAKALEKRLDEAETAQLDENERAIKEAADKARADTLAEVNGRIAAAEARALAASKTRDPEAAVQLLGDLSDFVADTGDVDADAMSAALDDLLERKPYLKPEATATAPAGGADQGRRQPADAPSLDDLEDPDKVLEAARALRSR